VFKPGIHRADVPGKSSGGDMSTIHPQYRAASRHLRHSWRVLPALVCASVLLMAAAAGAQTGNLCQATSACWEAPEILVQVKSVRVSMQGPNHFVTATLQFTNKTAAAYAMSYIHAGSVVTDNRGNRFTIAGKVSGLPPFSHQSTPGDFSLPPGGSREATVEYSLYDPRAQIGDQFDLTLATRELRPIGGNRIDPGVEHAVAIRGLTSGAMAMGNVSPLPAATVVAAAPTNLCAGQSDCFSEGPLQIKVLKISTQKTDEIDDEQHAAIFLKLSNRGDKPLVLSHRLGTAQLVDSNGNAYLKHGADDEDMVTVLGVFGGKGGAGSLVIEPGASRNVALRHRIERASKTRLSGRFGYEIHLVEIDAAAGSIRHDYLAMFRNLSSQALAAQAPPKTEFEIFQEQESKEFRRTRPSSVK
jgi:hypothetical protein